MHICLAGMAGVLLESSADGERGSGAWSESYPPKSAVTTGCKLCYLTREP